jgi:hypothetical protein
MQRNPKFRGLAGKCPGKVYHQDCTDTFIRIDENLVTNCGILRHQGFHQHPWPKAKKADKLSLMKLKAQIAMNPTPGAFKLKVCLDDIIH